MTDEPIRIVPYDPRWPVRFEQECVALMDAIGGWVAGGVHHVGSTAVPGLAAKPVIDILVGVRSLEESRACFGRLGELELPAVPREVLVRTPAGMTVLTENLARRASEAKETCEGEAEG